MKCHITVNDETTVYDLEPQCGEDFCDRCGDCLHCYGGDPCYYGGDVYEDPHKLGAHQWIVELEPDEVEAFIIERTPAPSPTP